MKRDLDLIREMLLAIEDAPHDKKITNFHFMGGKDSAVDEDWANTSYHVQLLLDSGFIETYEPLYVTGTIWPDFIVIRMTNQGCDYLDSVRSDKVWSAIKQRAGELFDSASLSTITYLGQEMIKSQIGI